jgi:hypothetical protein
VNETLVGRRPAEWLLHQHHWFYSLAIVTCLWRAVALARNRPSSWLVRLLLVTAAAIPAILLLHGMLAWGFHLPWPRARTGLFLPVLALLALGVAAAIPCPSRLGQTSATALTALLVAMGGYFLLCLRLTWFAEWSWNANSEQLYSIVARYSVQYGIRQIGTNWRYPSVLNYYRERSGRDTFDEIQYENPIPPGRSLYVLFPREDEAFRERERLQVVYHDPLSDAVVAIAPYATEHGAEMAPSPR